MAAAHPIQTTQPAIVYLTIKQLCEKHPAFRPGGIRALIFNENKNGLSKSGAIVRLGRKVMIDETKWFAWIESQNQAQGGRHE
jgi:hypothetical protein